MITLTPAYGRDYKSKTTLLEAFGNGTDFILNDMTSRWNGKPINVEQLEAGTMVQFRYGKLRKTFVHQVTK